MFCVQLLRSARKLKKFWIYFCVNQLSFREIDELVRLVRQRHILNEIAQIKWINYDLDEQVDLELGEKLELLFMTLRVTFPKLELILGKIQHYLKKIPTQVT
jgi:hypothetical protein